jgi:hypothetical protein
MEPLLTKFRGRCLVSNILMTGGKQFDSLPWLDIYPNRMCWLHSIAMCPCGHRCTFAAGHVAKGAITDAHADEVVAALQAGFTARTTREGPLLISLYPRFIRIPWSESLSLNIE